MSNEESKEITLLNSNDIELSKPIAYRVMQLHCAGFNQRQIANMLHVSKETVGNWLRKSEVAEAIDQYQKEENKIVDQALKSIRLKAYETMSELLDCDDDKVRFQASKDILDRTGHNAINKKEVTITHKTFEEQLSELVEDVDYQEISETD